MKSSNDPPLINTSRSNTFVFFTASNRLVFPPGDSPNLFFPLKHLASAFVVYYASNAIFDGQLVWLLLHTGLEG